MVFHATFFPRLHLAISYVPGSKLGWFIPPLIGNPYNRYKNPYFWIDDHPLLYGNNRSLGQISYHHTGFDGLVFKNSFMSNGWNLLISWPCNPNKKLRGPTSDHTKNICT